MRFPVLNSLPFLVYPYLFLLIRFSTTIQTLVPQQTSILAWELKVKIVFDADELIVRKVQ
jgi:hypothetical protein